MRSAVLSISFPAIVVFALGQISTSSRATSIKDFGARAESTRDTRSAG